MANTKKKSPVKKTQSKPAAKKPTAKTVKKPTAKKAAKKPVKPQVKDEAKAEAKVEPKVKTPVEKPQAKKSKKKFLIPLVCILGVAALAGAGVGIYFAVKGNKAKRVDVVVPEINGLVVNKLKAYVGKDYDTDISVDKTLTDWLLPDELTKVTSGNRTITNKEYTYDVADNKETATLHIPGKYIEDTVTITLELVEPTPPVDPYKVTEAEFKAACLFSGVQYVQKSLYNGTETKPVLVEELSPTVYHSLNEYDSYYAENFVKKDGNDYEKANRIVKEGTYTFEEAEESDFITPQSDYFNVASKLSHAGLSYSSFTYDSTTGTYSASFIPEGSETKVTTILKFENKKLVSEVNVEGDDTTQSITYTYLEKTPEYPEKPKFAVTPYSGTAVTYSAVQFDESSYTQGETVTGTIIPEEGCLIPEYATAIFFFADAEYKTPIFDIPVTYDKADEGEFSFTMPDQDIYVGAFCHSTSKNCIVKPNCENEIHPASISGTYGQTVTVSFTSPVTGYHIAVDLNEFLTTHYVIGDYQDGDLTYTYTAPTETSPAVGTLKISPIKSGFIIGGSAPADSI